MQASPVSARCGLNLTPAYFDLAVQQGPRAVVVGEEKSQFEILCHDGSLVNLVGFRFGFQQTWTAGALSVVAKIAG